jgi:hypothetical protein
MSETRSIVTQMRDAAAEWPTDTGTTPQQWDALRQVLLQEGAMEIERLEAALAALEAK